MSVIKSIFNPSLFVGKVAIVTGGATGIGAAIAHELAYLGCNVMIASRNEAKLQAAVDSMKMRKDLKGNVQYVKCNIREEDEVKNMMSTVLEKFGKLDYVVNNGGGQFMCNAENITSKGWKAVIDTNLTGTFNCCKHAYLSWMNDHGGVIVNIIVDMYKGFPFCSHSGAARAGVENLAKTLSLEWAVNGIRINCVAPGTIYSPTAVSNYPNGKEMFEKAAKMQPTCRLGKPEEISSAVCFLLSPAASYITGETLKVDGAQSLYMSSVEIPPHNNFPAWSWDEPLKNKL